MKIKTVYVPVKDVVTEPGLFDDQVNAQLENGWMLGVRKVIEAQAGASIDVLYAELVQLDPVPEPETPDPLEALRVIRDFCAGMSTEKCLTPACPLSDWCHYFTEDGVSPSDWRIPGEEATP